VLSGALLGPLTGVGALRLGHWHSLYRTAPGSAASTSPLVRPGRRADRGSVDSAMRIKALLASVAAAASSLGLFACGHPPAKASSEPFTVITMTSPAKQREVLLLPHVPARALVVFTHGYGDSQDQILKTSALFPLRDVLAEAGYAIAASNAHGNNYGNPTSIDDLVQLVRDAQSRLPGVTRIDVVAFSMGGLDALMLTSERRVPNLEAVVLLSPVCDQIAYLQSYFGGAIRAAFGHAKGSAPPVIAKSDPEKQDPQSFRGPRYWFWMSPDDTTVPPAQTASMVAILRSAGADVRYSPLDGNHGDLSKLTTGAVVAWLDA
jgi:pimeloyl-ACP methyl ester carboxylesterase